RPGSGRPPSAAAAAPGRGGEHRDGSGRRRCFTERGPVGPAGPAPPRSEPRVL
ncbi:MAG: hypothetical protein AVDCRST_MAG16-2734, partial [uncultured Frankineae bacterium]